ncbi:MAG: 3-deoxy-manno-octulosonate cytidylyltransferase [Planctomycetaceae bacterium]|nr:3-deoxy-manno-octulosonate cytidylyltransferase [Planctomycetaceae bacterium]
MTSFIVIPARLHSTRLAEKLLLAETGKPLIQHTYESAQKARRPSGIIVATDDKKIVAAVEAFAGTVVMTDPAAASGTDRVAEVAQNLPDVEIIVNVQGDEPDISADAIDTVVELLENNPAAVMATLATPIRRKAQLEDPACVKVVFDHQQRAMYFSRSIIPHARKWDDRLLESEPAHFYQHIGLYAYRRDFLLSLTDLPQSEVEKMESLEQLRVLSHGYTILVGVIQETSIGIDTQEDYDAFVRLQRNR